MVAELDDFLQNLGSSRYPGRYQTFVFLLLATNFVLVAFHTLNSVFVVYTPPHHCKVPDGRTLNESIPLAKDPRTERWDWDKCVMYANPDNHSEGTQPCGADGWTYHYEEGESTIVGEWDLVCNRAYLANLDTTLFFLGTLVGSSPTGMLSDKFGRKPILIYSLIINVIVGVILSFSTNYAMYAVFRFCHGIVLQGVLNAGTSLIFELCRRHRVEVAIYANTWWTIGQFILTFLAYYIPNWRYLYLAMSVPSIICITYFWVLPESLRWLISQNRVDDTIALVKKYYRINKIELDEDLDDQVTYIVALMEESKRGRETYDIRDLFRTPYIRRTTLVILFMWLVGSLCYYTAIFQVRSMDGDRYQNFLIGAGFDMVCRLILWPTLKKWGRRNPTILCFALSGLLCIVGVVLGNAFARSDILEKTSISFALLVKGTTGACTTCLMLYTSELFPTVIRGNAGGAGAFANRVGSMLAPVVLTLGDYVNVLIPIITMGTFSLVASVVCMVYLPETFRTGLPDTIEEAEVMSSRGRLQPQKSLIRRPGGTKRPRLPPPPPTDSKSPPGTPKIELTGPKSGERRESDRVVIFDPSEDDPSAEAKLKNGIRNVVFKED